MKRKTTKKVKTGKHVGGRPSKRNLIDLRQLEYVIKQGFTDKQICELFGISERTFNYYKKDNAQFLQAIKDWKKEADKNVAKALYHRAIGYQHEEDKIFCHEGEAVIVPTIKHYPPDTAACFIWLKNREPDEWRDKIEHEHKGKIDTTAVLVDTSKMTKDELREFIKEKLSG